MKLRKKELGKRTEGNTGKTGNCLPGKGHSVQKKKVTREVVGLTGKSDLLMNKVAEQ